MSRKIHFFSLSNYEVEEGGECEPIIARSTISHFVYILCNWRKEIFRSTTSQDNTLFSRVQRVSWRREDYATYFLFDLAFVVCILHVYATSSVRAQNFQFVACKRITVFATHRWQRGISTISCSFGSFPRFVCRISDSNFLFLCRCATTKFFASTSFERILHDLIY